MAFSKAGLLTRVSCHLVRHLLACLLEQLLLR